MADLEEVQRHNAISFLDGFNLPPELQSGGSKSDVVAVNFVTFVQKLVNGLGLKRGTSSEITTISRHELQDDNNQRRLLQRIWEEQANSWAAIEGDEAYLITMKLLLESLMVNQRTNSRVLSLGSGPGLYEIFLGGLYQEFYGHGNSQITSVDYSSGMIGFQKKILSKSKTYRGNRIENVRPEQQNMAHLRFGDRKFDTIICNNSLEWVPDWQLAISEMARVLDTRFVGQLNLVIHFHPMQVQDGKTSEILLQTGPENPEEIENALQTNGFEMKKITSFTFYSAQTGKDTTRFFIEAYKR